MPPTSPHALDLSLIRDTEPVLPCDFADEDDSDDDTEVTATMKRPVVNASCDHFMKIR